jgi:hypothetical protein
MTIDAILMSILKVFLGAAIIAIIYAAIRILLKVVSRVNKRLTAMAAI